jgi:FlaA1/EpsC-like NDP-sugar epimerase
VKIGEIGPRPGEKMWEELNTEEEARRTYDLGKYLVVLPALAGPYGKPNDAYRESSLRPCEKIYRSTNETLMSEAEIEALLLRPGVLPEDMRHRLGFASGEH